VKKFVNILAEGRWSLPKYNVHVLGFSLPLTKTDRHQITEKLLSMAKSDKQKKTNKQTNKQKTKQKTNKKTNTHTHTK
jgi:hypothetical protein